MRVQSSGRDLSLQQMSQKDLLSQAFQRGPCRGKDMLEEDGIGAAPRRRVLVLTCHYPPIHSSQAVRVGKLLKHLPCEGWIPDIVCAIEDPIFGSDPSLTTDIPPESRVVRVSPRIRGQIRIPRKLQVPDHMSGWIVPATIAAFGLTKALRYAAILSFSFPASSHVAGLLTAHLSGLPWLADFSDPWMSNPYRVEVRPSPRYKLNKALEARVFRRADLLGFVTPEFRDYESAFHRGVKEKSVIVPHCGERTDFQAIDDMRTDRVFRVVHVGSLYGLRRPDHLFRGFAMFLESHPNVDAELRLIGPWSLADPGLRNWSPNLRDRVIITPQIARKDALREMRSADLLVLIDPNPTEPGIFLPLKLVEYLISGRPIIALTVPGPSQQLVERYAAGAAVRYDDPVAIAKKLAELYEARDLSVTGVLRDLPELEARSSARSFAATLKRLVSGGTHPSRHSLGPNTEQAVAH